MALIVATVAAGACACKNGKTTGGGGTTIGTGGSSDAGVNSKGDPAKCEKARPKVVALYEKEIAAATKPNADDETRARNRQTVADNTEMMMVDCHADPNRFAPCLEAAASVEQMERDCLVPLDDEGTVEGRAFGKE